MGRSDRADKWITSKEHETNPKQQSTLGQTHTDTVHYNSQGERDSGKLKVSGPSHPPSMRDIHPPVKK